MYNYPSHKIIDGTEYKKCCACKEFLGLDMFYQNWRHGDKLSYICKGCNRINHRQYRLEIENNYWHDDDIISIEDLRIKLKHDAELDRIEEIGYDAWYWESLEEYCSDD